ncbi:MAG TPA: hypothetical protein VF796_01560 [Humisphaera sp.]
MSPPARAARLLTLCALALLAGGCFSPTGPAEGDTEAQERFWTQAPEADRVDALRREILEACPTADPAEAADVAGVCIRYGQVLGDEYGLFRPIEYNNLAVFFGLKKRGLCYELADEMYVRLRAMKLRTLALHRVTANADHPVDEHNVVVLTDRFVTFEPGQSVTKGVVVDAWRYAGKLRFIAVAKDHQHDWKKRAVTAPPPADLIVDDVTPQLQRAQSASSSPGGP